MISLTVDSKDAIATLRRLIDGLDDAVMDGMLEAAQEGEDVAQKRSKGSVRKGVDVHRRGRAVSLVATAPWSGIVEHGRGAVHAKGDGFLRFEVGGRVVFAKRVGPARPRPFMKPAGVTMQKSMAVDEAIERLVR